MAIAEGGGGRGELIEGGFAQVARHTEGTGFDRVCFEHVACVAELRHPILRVRGSGVSVRRPAGAGGAVGAGEKWMLGAHLNVRKVFLRLNQGLVLFRGAGGRSAPVHGF